MSESENVSNSAASPTEESLKTEWKNAVENRRKIAFNDPHGRNALNYGPEASAPPNDQNTPGKQSSPGTQGTPDSEPWEGPDQNWVGLALSGGGLRSALFNIGLLQAFSHRGLLRYVDYISSVSGGGYANGWLVSQVQKYLQNGERDFHTTPTVKKPQDSAASQRAIGDLFVDPLTQQPTVTYNRCWGRIGQYLNSPQEIAWKYVASTLVIWVLFLSIILTGSALLAMIWRLFDHESTRVVMHSLGMEFIADELFYAFIPPLLIAGLWGVAMLSHLLASCFGDESLNDALLRTVKTVGSDKAPSDIAEPAAESGTSEASRSMRWVVRGWVISFGVVTALLLAAGLIDTQRNNVLSPLFGLCCWFFVGFGTWALIRSPTPGHSGKKDEANQNKWLIPAGCLAFVGYLCICLREPVFVTIGWSNQVNLALQALTLFLVFGIWFLIPIAFLAYFVRQRAPRDQRITNDISSHAWWSGLLPPSLANATITIRGRKPIRVLPILINLYILYLILACLLITAGQSGGTWPASLALPGLWRFHLAAYCSACGILGWSLFRRQSHERRNYCKWLFLAFAVACGVSIAVYLGNGESRISQKNELVQFNSYVAWLTLIAAVLQVLPIFFRDQLLNSEREDSAPWQKWVAESLSWLAPVFLLFTAVHWMAREDLSGYIRFRDPEVVRTDIIEWSGFSAVASRLNRTPEAANRIAKHDRETSFKRFESRGAYPHWEMFSSVPLLTFSGTFRAAGIAFCPWTSAAKQQSNYLQEHWEFAKDQELLVRNFSKYAGLSNTRENRDLSAAKKTAGLLVVDLLRQLCYEELSDPSRNKVELPAQELLPLWTVQLEEKLAAFVPAQEELMHAQWATTTRLSFMRHLSLCLKNADAVIRKKAEEYSDESREKRLLKYLEDPASTTGGRWNWSHSIGNCSNCCTRGSFGHAR